MERIKYEDYVMTPSIASPDRFDLGREVLKRRVGDGTRNNPTGEEYLGVDDLGYDMRLSTCFERIAFELTNRALEGEVTIKEYLDQFQQERKKIIEAIDDKVQF
jgi:hypothetical protein